MPGGESMGNPENKDRLIIIGARMEGLDFRGEQSRSPIRAANPAGGGRENEQNQESFIDALKALKGAIDRKNKADQLAGTDMGTLAEKQGAEQYYNASLGRTYDALGRGIQGQYQDGMTPEAARDVLMEYLEEQLNRQVKDGELETARTLGRFADNVRETNFAEGWLRTQQMQRASEVVKPIETGKPNELPIVPDQIILAEEEKREPEVVPGDKTNVVIERPLLPPDEPEKRAEWVRKGGSTSESDQEQIEDLRRQLDEEEKNKRSSASTVAAAPPAQPPQEPPPAPPTSPQESGGEEKWWKRALGVLLADETIEQASRWIRRNFGRRERNEEDTETTENKRNPSWRGESWNRIWESLRGDVSENANIKDPETQKHLQQKQKIVSAAEKDGVLKEIYLRSSDYVGKVDLGNGTDEEIDLAWRRLQTRFNMINPQDLERDALGRMGRRAEQVYGGLNDAYHQYVGREIQLALLRAERNAGLINPGEPQLDTIKELERVQNLMRFGPVPSGIDNIAMAYAQMEKRQIDAAARAARAAGRLEPPRPPRAPEPPRQPGGGSATVDSGTSVEALRDPISGIFSEIFLAKRGILASEYYQPTQTGQRYHVNVFQALEYSFKKGGPPWIIRGEDVNTAGFSQNFETTSQFETFTKGVLPLITLWIGQDQGTYSELMGSAEKPGLVNQVSLYHIATAFNDDPEAKRALEIFLQMDPAKSAGKKVIDIRTMTKADRSMAERLSGQFSKDMSFGHLDVDHGSQDSRSRLKDIADQVAAYLHCDRGTAYVMAELATLISGTGKQLDYRKLTNKYPEARYFNEEKITLPLIAQIFSGQTDSEVEKNKKDNHSMVEYVNHGGVTELFNLWIEKQNAVRFPQAIANRVAFLSAMEKLELYEKGMGDIIFEGERQNIEKKIKEKFSSLMEPVVTVISVEYMSFLLERVLSKAPLRGVAARSDVLDEQAKLTTKEIRRIETARTWWGREAARREEEKIYEERKKAAEKKSKK